MSLPGDKTMRRWIRQAQRGDNEAMHKIIFAHTGLFCRCLRSELRLPKKSGVPLPTYLGALSIAMIRCVHKYVGSEGASLLTYSYTSLCREIRKQRYENKLIRPPSEPHKLWIDPETGCQIPEMRACISRAIRSYQYEPLKQDYPDRHHNGRPLWSPSMPENLTMFHDWDWDRWELELRFLSWREKRIMELRFRDGETLEEVGQKMKVSRERIRQIEQKAINKVRRRLWHLQQAWLTKRAAARQGPWTTAEIQSVLREKGRATLPTELSQPLLVELEYVETSAEEHAGSCTE